MADHLRANDPSDAHLLAALPAASAALTVRVVRGLRVLVLRHLAGDTRALDEALAGMGLTPLPQAGAWRGNDPWLVWISPTERWMMTTRGPDSADAVLRALQPGRHALACALDQSAGSLVFELTGPAVGDVLARLCDAISIPQQAGQATRARFMDIAAVVLRRAPDEAWLLVERSHAVYAARWIGERASRYAPLSLVTEGNLQ
jgi:heterotetrameric sarcosine oxidase gamma subunit